MYFQFSSSSYTGCRLDIINIIHDFLLFLRVAPPTARLPAGSIVVAKFSSSIISTKPVLLPERYFRTSNSDLPFITCRACAPTAACHKYAEYIQQPMIDWNQIGLPSAHNTHFLDVCGFYDVVLLQPSYHNRFSNTMYRFQVEPCTKMYKR